MSDAEVYYRVHWNWDTVPFDAEHAWSYRVGPSGEPGREECVPCDGTGELPDHLGGEDGKCTACGGEGAVDADRGYSCCTSPEDLAENVSHFGAGADEFATARVIVFEGDAQGYGLDGEMLVVPSRIVRVMTWGEFTAENR